jgi:hypothetical protein
LKDIPECYIKEEAEHAEVRLEMIVVAEEIAPGFMPNKVMSVGSCDDAEPAVGYPGPLSPGILSKWETQYQYL